MKTTDAHLILGTAHLGVTPGKCSPDKVLSEAKWSREIVTELYDIFSGVYGINTYIDYLSLMPDQKMTGKDADETQSLELSRRVKVVNTIATRHPGQTFYISIHVNGAGNSGNWTNARGWSAYTSVGKTKSDTLAEFLYKAADKNLTEYKNSGKFSGSQKPIRTDKSDGDLDLEARYYVLRKTSCPAVLTENMYQDNKDDVKFLMSDAGKQAIIRLHIEGFLEFLKTA